MEEAGTPEGKSTELQVTVTMEQGEIRTKRFEFIPSGRFRSQPVKIATDASFNRKGALAKKMLVFLDNDLTSKYQLVLVGPALVTTEGPVTLSVTNFGLEPCQLQPGTLIGQYVVFKGNAQENVGK